jgi:hypothetical protein
VLAFDFAGGWATFIYVLGGVGLILTVADKLFGWVDRIRTLLGRAPADPARRREHDERVLAKLRETLPRNHVLQFLRAQDFGGPWRAAAMEPIFDLELMNNPEDRFIDPRLEALRVQLHTTISSLSHLLAVDSFPQHGNGDWQDVGVKPYGSVDVDAALWEQRSTALNEAATVAADAYDALIDEARRNALLQ